MLLFFFPLFLSPDFYICHILTSSVVECTQNLANPTALLLSAVTMLRHLELYDKAERIQNAILTTIAEGKYRTADLGGSSSTTDFTKAICGHL